jgi:predicted  nucleic acid-binding Zn-ribbon protein
MSAESTVRKLHPEQEATRQAPAIGMSLVMNLGGDRQATLQCFIAQEDGEDKANDLLDRMFRIGDRQKARYELDGLTDELAKHESTLTQLNEDFDRLEKEFATKSVELQEEVRGYQAEAEALRQEGYNKWAASGRRGEYHPEGYTKSGIARAEDAAMKAAEAMTKAANERTNEMAGIRVSQLRYGTEIERIKSEIAKRRTLLGMNDGA